MRKPINLHSGNGVENKYTKWATEAIEEFLRLFPEHADKFDIHPDKITDNKEVCSKEYYEAVLATIQSKVPELEFHLKKVYKKQADGSYTTSLKDIFEQAKGSTGLALPIIQGLRYNRNNHESAYEVVVFDERATMRKNGGYVIGMAGRNALYLSTKDLSGQPLSEKDFKDLVIHEFGHVFDATFMKRQGQNSVVERLGPHCTDKCCQMYEYAYQKQYLDGNYRSRGENPFCDDCMREMKRRMDGLFSSQTSVNSLPLPETKLPSEANLQNAKKEFKKPLRHFWSSVATQEKSAYLEDFHSPNYRATITRKDGSSTILEASGENKLSLSAKDAKGKPKVPDYKYFKDIVAYAKSRNTSVTFGNIPNEEFKARLLAACMEADVKTIGAPMLDKTFLGKITPETKTILETLQNKNQPKQPVRSTKARA